MSMQPALSSEEAADRLAIRELIDAYARCADRRDAAGQMALFTEDSHFAVYMDATLDEPTQELHGRDALAPSSTTSTPTSAQPISTARAQWFWTGRRAAGESYCLAHHLSVGEGGRRTMMIASLRYLDEFVKQDGIWLFAGRRLMVDWTETRPSSA